MSAHEVIFQRLAKAEFKEAIRWYGRRSLVAPQRFRAAVDAAIGRITTDPNALPAIDQVYRRIPVKRYPYSLIFRMLRRDAVLIVAVMHNHRRPGYWRRRKLP